MTAPTPKEKNTCLAHLTILNGSKRQEWKGWRVQKVSMHEILSDSDSGFAAISTRHPSLPKLFPSGSRQENPGGGCVGDLKRYTALQF